MINYNQTLQTNNSSLEDIIEQINHLPDAGGSQPNLQDKTVDPTTSEQIVNADNGYDGLGTVTVNAMPVTEVATPVIRFNPNNGLIAATTTQNTGYTNGGITNSTLQLAF